MDTIGRFLPWQVSGLVNLMMDMERKITAITAQKRNTRRLNIHLDGEFAFSLSRLVAAWLQTGMFLSDEKITQLKSDDEYETVYQRVLNWISFRPRTEAEIRKRLMKLSISSDVTQSIIDRLRHNQLVDDKEFADRWVLERSNLRPRSQKALAYELRQHGVSPEIIQDALESVDDDQMAYQAALQKARKIGNLEWMEFRLKMLRFLAGKGFSYQTSSAVVKRVWDEKLEE